MTDNDRPSKPERSGRPGDPGKNRGPRKPSSQGGGSGRSRGDSSRGDSSRSDAPRSGARPPREGGTERPRGSFVSGDRRRDDRPRSDRSSREGSGSDQNRRDQPRAERSWGRPSRDERPRSDRSRSDRPGSERPQGERRSFDKPGSDRPRTDRPRTDRPRTDRPRSDRPGTERSGGDRPWSDRPPREQRSDRRENDENAPRHDDPVVDEDVTPSELDKAAWRELKALTKENAEWVAGHLVMASRVVDDDPERAHRHALAAARRAGRVPVVRETVGITSYLTGNFALALRELRTYRRLSGSHEQLPLMVDCERGLGRPDRALELAADVDRSTLPVAVQVELAIARSGARLDMGRADLALGELEIPQLKPDLAYSFSPALFDSYAIVLEELGRLEEAEIWGKRADIAAAALADARGDEAEEDTVVVMEEPLEMPVDGP